MRFRPTFVIRFLVLLSHPKSFAKNNQTPKHNHHPIHFASINLGVKKTHIASTLPLFRHSRSLWCPPMAFEVFA